MLSRLATATRAAAARGQPRSTSFGLSYAQHRAALSTTVNGSSKKNFVLPSLSYEYDALEPHLDSTTQEIHYKRHHQTYVSNLNGLLNGAGKDHLSGKSLADINKSCATLPEGIRTPVINSAGGHYNHTLWWSTLRPEAPAAPPGDLRAKIDADFGELDAMKKEFEDAAAKRFGSGWAWLSLGGDGKLFISSTANQENPLMEGHVAQAGTPILGLDVWEHAYYLKYQNRRPEYIKAFWNVVDWDRVAANYESALSGGTAVFDVPMEE